MLYYSNEAASHREPHSQKRAGDHVQNPIDEALFLLVAEVLHGHDQADLLLRVRLQCRRPGLEPALCGGDAVFRLLALTQNRPVRLRVTREG